MALHLPPSHRWYFSLICLLDEAGHHAGADQAGHPEQNGRHERMHRTLKAETAKPPAANGERNNKPLIGFRQQFNEERPHEALGQKTPASCYHSSPRPYPDRIPKPEYDTHMKPKRVYPDGTFLLERHTRYLSASVWGRIYRHGADRRALLGRSFATFPLARFDSHKLVLQPMPDKEQ